MRAIPINRRRDWQSHIMNNAYQAEVLSDAKQKYWVEALPQPFCIQFSSDEETILAQATETLGKMCQEYLDWFFTDDDEGVVDKRLESLKIRKEYWTAIKLSWDRINPEELCLYTRFDFVVSPDGDAPKMIEINGETPLLGCEQVYQWNWLQDMLARGDSSVPRDANQFNEFWELVAQQFAYIIDYYGIKGKVFSFLVDEQLNEDKEMAAQLIQIIQDEVDAGQYCQMVYLRDELDDDNQIIQRGIGMDEEGYLVDHCNERIFFLWKVYDWSDLQNDVDNFGMTDVFVKRLEVGDVKFIEPLWKQVLSNKGSMVYMWELFKNHPEYGQYLLETYFENDLRPEVTSLIVDTHIRKPMLGLEGVGTSLQTGFGSALEERETFGYGQEGFIVQEYVPLPCAYDYHYMVGSWLIGGLEDGDAAGIIIRGDKNRITGRYCLIIPHIVSDTEIIVS